MTFCGLDFGTSNSTAGVFKDGQLSMAPLDHGGPVLRSAIFLDFEEQKGVFGHDAIEHYVDGVPGRLLTSVKSVLGTNLMDDQTVIFGQMKPFSEILGFFIGYMKSQTEAYLGQQIDSVVLGRPYRFNDKDDSADLRASNTLRDIAKSQGFKNIEFMYEPVAAAMSYAATVEKEETAVIIDIGGGTSDFTLLKIDPTNKSNPSSIISTAGIHIGGTDFDQLLSYKRIMPELGLGSKIKAMNGSFIEIPRYYYSDLSTWHRINSLYDRQVISSIEHTIAFSDNKDLTGRLIKVLTGRYGHHLINNVESSKKTLSVKDQATVDLSCIEDAFEINVLRSEFEDVISAKISDIRNALSEMLNAAGVTEDKVDTIFYTGGSTKISYLRDTLNDYFSNANVVEGDAFSTVGKGLTLEANRIFR